MKTDIDAAYLAGVRLREYDSGPVLRRGGRNFRTGSAGD